MLGWFKRKPAPEGPVQIMVAIEVGTSVEAFFDLLDFASPTNAKMLLGHSVIGVGPDQYALVMNFLPDLVFEITVEECQAPASYAYHTPIPAGVGPLLWTVERFDLEPRGPDSCEVHLLTTGEFRPGLSLTEYQQEIAKLSLAVQNALMKLKILAEGGIDQVKAFELRQAA